LSIHNIIYNIMDTGEYFYNYIYYIIYFLGTFILFRNFSNNTGLQLKFKSSKITEFQTEKVHPVFLSTTIRKVRTIFDS